MVAFENWSDIVLAIEHARHVQGSWPKAAYEVVKQYKEVSQVMARKHGLKSSNNNKPIVTTNNTFQPNLSAFQKHYNLFLKGVVIY